MPPMLTYKDWDRMSSDEKLEILRSSLRDVVDNFTTEINRLKIRLEATENRK